MITNIDGAIDYFDDHRTNIIAQASEGDSQAKSVIQVVSRYFAFNEDVRMHEIVIETVNNYIDDKEE